MDNQIIHVQWEGPCTIEDLSNYNDSNKDYGLYQIYGSHPVYGLNSLLYIGKAAKQTFKERITSEWWEFLEDYEGKYTLYLGRISGSETPTDTVWERTIDVVETLLINSHKPAWNKVHVGFLNVKADKQVMKVHILNWGEYGALLPEVSGLRWSSKFDYVDNYGPYGSQ